MLLMLSVLLPPALGATFAEVPSWSALSARSAAIVRGEVIEARTEPCSLGLCTRHTVRVEEVLKGTAPATVEITLPGGHYRGLIQRASGIPLWNEGSDVILFIDGEGTVPLTGLLTVDGDRPVDLLFREVPASVEDLRATLRANLPEPNPHRP